MAPRRAAVYGGLAALIVAGLVLHFVVLPAQVAEVPPAEQRPRGRWHAVGPAATEAAGDPDLARVLSLPYARGGAPATGSAGVTVHDPERTSPGYNLYTSGHAPEAVLTDLHGRGVQRWRCRFERAFPERAEEVAGDDASLYFRRARLLPDGDLLALFQGLGLVRLDRRSEVVWARALPVFNDLHRTGDGRILTLVKEPRLFPELHRDGPVLEDSVVVLDADGRELRRLSLLAAMRRSRFRGLLEPLGPTADLLHSNSVELLEEARLKGKLPGGPLRTGHLLVSLREVDTVAVVDPESGRAVWAQRGPWKRQHEPVPLENGHLLVFDNRGGPEGHSRVVEVDPVTGEVVWSFPGDPSAELSSVELVSAEAGTVAALPGGNLLITESERGRAIEITRGGEVVWEFRSPHRAGPGDRLVATLFEVERLPPERIETWLPR